VAGLALTSAVALGAAPASAAPSELAGTFRITAGSCSAGAHGSYFRMVNPTGTAESGPFVSNSDSACSDKTYTLLSPGTDGGLISGAYQPAPSPGFDGAGNSLAVRVIRPVRFFGVDFSASTEPKDLQNGASNPVPRFAADGSTLTGDTRAFDATWNKQSFNQGGPKPDGSTPGITAAPKGTFDATTNAYAVTWTSQIVGGPFNNFTGVWHLEGTYVAASKAGGSASAAGAKATATTTRSPKVTTLTTLAGATDTSTVVAGETVRRVAGRPVVHEGWKAPAGVVLAVAAVGVLAVLAWLLLDRRGVDAS
jgi:hypothetical protein